MIYRQAVTAQGFTDQMMRRVSTAAMWRQRAYKLVVHGVLERHVHEERTDRCAAALGHVDVALAARSVHVRVVHYHTLACT